MTWSHHDHLQQHINHFFRFCYKGGIDRIAKLSPIKIDAPDTEPLTDEEYEKILTAATGKTRTLIKLMRWSGLATRDASTAERTDLHFDTEKDIYRIIPERHVNVKDFEIGGAKFSNGPTGTPGLSPANRFFSKPGS